MPEQQQQGGLFAKGGGDSINLFGHKVPIALIGGIAAVAMVIVVLRARKSGASAAVGAQPVGSALGAYGSQGFAPDYSAALADITQQLTNLQQQGLSGSGAPAAAPSGSGLTVPPNRPFPFTPPAQPWPWAPPTGEQQIGSGWGPVGGFNENPITDMSGGLFEWIPNPDALTALLGGGGQAYVQTTPGNFVLYDPKTTVPGTPIFERIRQGG